MALTDTAIRNAKPKEKPYKLGDSGGLFLLVQPNGSKLWKLKYRFAGKEKKLSIGAYPTFSLADARSTRDEARRLLAKDMDPGIEKARKKAQVHSDAEVTFEFIAREYIAKRTAEGWAMPTLKKAKLMLGHLQPGIGRMPITQITAPDVLAVVRPHEKLGKHETARRMMQLAGTIFRYAVATARLESDPTRDLRGALTAPKIQHYGAILDPQKVGQLLRAIDGYQGHLTTAYALKLAPHVYVRPGELRHADWSEFDFANAVWIIPAERMKMRRPHNVPLSRQVIALLEEWRAVSGRNSGYVFASIRSMARPMSENTLNAALRRLGYSSEEMTSHGFRAMASTLLNESGKWHPDAIERALAHQDSNNVRAAYHRGAHWQERVEMAQWWSDYLDELRAG